MSAQNYPYRFRHTVTFGELDALGHVNNAVYFTYLENARIAYFFDAMGVHSLRELTLILAEATCSYKSPAHFGETLVIGMGVTRLGNKSFDLHYRIETEDGRLVAICKSVQVFFDYETGKTIPLPEKFIKKVKEIQGDWQPESA